MSAHMIDPTPGDAVGEAAFWESGQDGGVLSDISPEVLRLIKWRLAYRGNTPRPDCRVWIGKTDRSGYGHVSILGTTHQVHRVAWELAHGLIPDGLVIDHLCRIPGCFNTDHMELVSQAENTRRARAACTEIVRAIGERPAVSGSGGRVAATHCQRGHEMTEENTVIYPDRRRCRTCRRINEQARPSRSKAKT